MTLRDVSFRYDRAGGAVVRQFSASLMPGRLCVLLGPNAAGKTTLLKLMLGQLVAESGRCELLGEDVACLSGVRRATALSYVPQQGQTAFAFTVRQVVAMGRFALLRDDAAIDDALAHCELVGLAHRVFAELSAGQQQRVLLARAMAQSHGQGRVMLLDEPVSSMDLHHVHETMGLLLKLARGGLAVLAVLHDLNLAARWADEIWLMHEGRLTAGGSVAEVMRPDVLERVYKVSLRAETVDKSGRPMLIVDSPLDLE